MEAEEKGIQETKEAILAVVALGAFVVERLKDGVQLEDLTALVMKMIGDAEFKLKLEAGANGMDLIPSEIEDISLTEAVELIGLLPEIVAVFKK